MASLRQHELSFLLSSSDPSLNKRGLQRICDAIERGAKVNLSRDPHVYYLIANLKGIEDQKARLWLYKLIGLTRERPFAAWLSARIENDETHPENLTWGFGALSALIGRVNARKVLERSGHNPFDIAFEIAADYFSHSIPLDPRILRDAMSGDYPLAHQWLSMRHGQYPHTVPLGTLRDLSASSDDVVVEYALWAAYKDRMADILNVALDPGDFHKYPDNVRRWYLRVLLKNPANVLPYSDIVRMAVGDASNQVREALAIGLNERRLSRHLGLQVAEWYAREEDPLVQMVLRKLVVANGSLRDLRDLAGFAREAIILDYGGHIDIRRPARILLSRRLRIQEDSTLRPIPVIDYEKQEQVYILGVDTVEFSKKTDRQQYTIFRDLLDWLQHQELVVSQKSSDVCILPAGDGFFICFRGVENRLLPVRLALALRDDFAALRVYALRFGVNAGPATWITMKDGHSQLISHAVNWTARVMSAAAASQIFASSSYYETYIAPARDELFRISFSPIDAGVTKHGEPLRLWQID